MIIKQLTGGGGSTNIPILNDGGAQHISAKDKTEAFTAIFSQKCQVDDPSQPPPVVPSISDASLQPIRFTPRDIRKLLKVLDNAVRIPQRAEQIHPISLLSNHHRIYSAEGGLSAHRACTGNNPTQVLSP